jgi:hypothetical protein
MFFQNQEHRIVIHITKQTTKQELFEWLKENHNDIFISVNIWDVEFCLYIDEDEIRFEGDNGFFILERCKLMNLASKIKEIS